MMSFFKYIFIFFLFIFSINNYFSQDKKEETFKKKFETANSLMHDKLFELSKNIWLKLANSDTTNANINYKTGICLLETTDYKFKSLIYLKRALSNIEQN